MKRWKRVRRAIRRVGDGDPGLPGHPVNLRLAAVDAEIAPVGSVLTCRLCGTSERARAENDPEALADEIRTFVEAHRPCRRKGGAPWKSNPSTKK